ncbi:MAG TPA: CDP-archaeol synthase [Gemmatimonadaceae bacterium]|nr:CDP-archaeol synthase [Gemmatimonadaceae bacterium]
MVRVTELLYLMLPAYLANMTPPFIRFWHGWNRPISERWLGSHKTVAGAVAGICVAFIAAFAQSRVHWQGSILDYDRWPLIGLLLGTGAIGGDIVKSFFKRRMKIAPGGRWIPADQLDFGIGALILISSMAHLSWLDAVTILAITFVGDIIVNQLAFRLHIRDTAW